MRFGYQVEDGGERKFGDLGFGRHEKACVSRNSWRGRGDKKCTSPTRSLHGSTAVCTRSRGYNILIQYAFKNLLRNNYIRNRMAVYRLYFCIYKIQPREYLVDTVLALITTASSDVIRRSRDVSWLSMLLKRPRMYWS